MFKYKIFADNVSEWKKYCDCDYFDHSVPECKEYEQAYVLPVKPDGRQNINCSTGFAGGVCDNSGKFVAGMTRLLDRHTGKSKAMAFAVNNAYPFDANSAKYIDEEAIYCGIVVPWFGHLISDSMVFLWYAAKNVDKDCKFVFLSAGNCQPPEVFFNLMEVMGIERRRILIVDKIYKFRKIYVPDQSFYHHGSYTCEMLSVYSHIAKRAVRDYDTEAFREKYRKVYFTRSALNDKTGFNEGYFERFYKDRGYTIVAPETLPLKEQLAIFAVVEEMVCLYGSLTELMAFSLRIKKMTILLRVNEPSLSIPTIRYLQAQAPDCSIIDVSMNPLPTTLANGRYYVGPSRFWIQYLKEERIPYSNDDVKMDWSYLHDYMQEYATTYSNPNSLSVTRMKDSDFFDYVNRMSFVLNGIELDREQMRIKSKAELNNEITRLQALTQKMLPDSVLPVYPALRAVPPTVSGTKLIKVFSRKSLIVDSVPYSRELCINQLLPYYDAIRGSWLRVIGLFYARRLAPEYDIMMHSETVPDPFTQEQLDRLASSEISAVFQMALMAGDGIKKYYTTRYGQDTVNRILCGLKKSPKSYDDVLTRPNAVIYNSTVLVVKKQSYNRFADWMLPIMNDIGRELDNSRIGVLSAAADMLTTVYFNAHPVIVTASIN